GAGDGKQFNMGGFSQTVGLLTGTGDITLDGTLTVGAGSSADFTDGNKMFNAIDHPERAASAALIKTGSKIMTLTADNSNWSGKLQIDGGTIQFNDRTNLGDGTGTLAFNSGTNRRVLGTATLGATVRVLNDMEMQRPVVLNVGGSVFDTRHPDPPNGDHLLTLSGVVSGSGALGKINNGTLSLKGTANTYA